MIRLISMLMWFLIFYACRQSTPVNTGEKEKNSQTAESKADSIDRENRASIIASGDLITKAYVSAADSIIYLTANMKMDHRIFGYARPDTTSQRLILLSIFTNDVENNPFQCTLGAYYDTAGMENIKLKFQAEEGNFIHALALENNQKSTPVYFEKKWISYE